MALLNYDVLKKSGYDGYILEDAPVKVLSLAREISFVHLWITGLILQMKRPDGTESAVWYSPLLRVWQR